MAAGSSSTCTVRLPWFRVHSVILNEPGRLLSVHIVHTGLVCGLVYYLGRQCT
jgi:hypothetical protein